MQVGQTGQLPNCLCCVQSSNGGTSGGLYNNQSEPPRPLPGMEGHSFVLVFPGGNPFRRNAAQLNRQQYEYVQVATPTLLRNFRTAVRVETRRKLGHHRTTLFPGRERAPRKMTTEVPRTRDIARSRVRKTTEVGGSQQYEANRK